MEKFKESSIEALSDRDKYLAMSKDIYPRTKGLDPAEETRRNELQAALNGAYRDLQQGLRAEFDRLWEIWSQARAEKKAGSDRSGAYGQSKGHLGQNIDIKA